MSTNTNHFKGLHSLVDTLAWLRKGHGNEWPAKSGFPLRHETNFIGADVTRGGSTRRVHRFGCQPYPVHVQHTWEEGGKGRKGEGDEEGLGREGKEGMKTAFLRFAGLVRSISSVKEQSRRAGGLTRDGRFHSIGIHWRMHRVLPARHHGIGNRPLLAPVCFWSAHG